VPLLWVLKMSVFEDGGRGRGLLCGSVEAEARRVESVEVKVRFVEVGMGAFLVGRGME